jgi:hypothetical protein
MYNQGKLYRAFVYPHIGTTTDSRAEHEWINACRALGVGSYCTFAFIYPEFRHHRELKVGVDQLPPSLRARRIGGMAVCYYVW